MTSSYSSHESLVHEPYRIVRSILFLPGCFPPLSASAAPSRTTPPRSNSIQLDQLEERIVGASGEFFSAAGRNLLGERRRECIVNKEYALGTHTIVRRSQHLVIRY